MHLSSCTVFFEIAQEFVTDTRRSEVGDFSEKGTYRDGRKMRVDLHISKREDITKKYLVRYSKGSKFQARSADNSYRSLWKECLGKK